MPSQSRIANQLTRSLVTILKLGRIERSGLGLLFDIRLHSQKRLMDYWGYRQPDFARCSTITVFPPVDAVGLVQVISSPLISARLFCFVPSQFGKLLPMTSKLIEPSELTA